MNDVDLVLVGLGANLPSRYGAPPETLLAALAHLDALGIRIVRRSRFWHTRPVPISDQPWFVNAVAAVETQLSPADLLAEMHGIEADFGRVRGVVNAARPLDLDLLAYGRLCLDAPDGPIVPHPRLADRAFVLLPIRDIAPLWRHPRTDEDLPRMIARLPVEQKCRPDGSEEGLATK